MCAGILSSCVTSGLRALGLEVPQSVVMGHLHRYVLHWQRTTISIEQPDPTREILSVFRSAGPKDGDLTPEVSFDAFVLAQAQEAGATIVSERVVEIVFPPGRLPMLRTTQRQAAFDLIVLATGVNSRPPTFFGLNYHPPPTITMAQDELQLERPADPSCVHIYCDEPTGLIFGGLVPKGEYVNVSLLGYGLSGTSLDHFLEKLCEKGVLQSVPQRLCGCRPRVAVGPATGYYGDRFVAVGDAAVTRLYKDGIGSALQTARWAATTALERGISARAFRQGYHPMVKTIARDNRFGRLLFKSWQLVKGEGIMATLGQRLLMYEQRLPPEQRAHSRLLWYMFTGDAPYCCIAYGLFSWPAMRNVLRAIWFQPASKVQRV